MRYADLQYSTSMCEDFAISVGETFELSTEQINNIKKQITTIVQEEIENNE